MNDASGYGQPAFEGENAAGETAPAAIVGIGASAGGIEALEQFFRNMPPDSGATFVVVQHLSPDFRSMMDELLGRWTRMRVYRVEDGMRVEPDTVYLIPPRKQMILSAGRLLLADTDPAEQVHLPIDTFFRSLAREAGSDAIGIILSGSGSDGSRGAIELRDAGALVLVQRPESASFDSMPRNAVDAGAASEIVDPEGMPEVLLARLGRPLPAKPPAELADGMAEVFRLLQGACGIDFSHYKSETVTRRIERRIAMLRSADLDAYIERLRDDREELNALYRDLLIGVTRFFRDPEFFEYLADELLPPILEAVPEGTEFRVWVAACATGEEAYSLAIILHEILARNGRDVNVKIFATDVHEASLERAGAGEYPPESLEGMDAERRERYFTQSGLFLRVIPELRKMVVFAPQNLLRDPPFRAMDLITCRNLLIYLKPEAQHKVVSLLHFALKPGGTLFLGSSESPAGLQDGFEILQSRFKVYRKRRSVPARLPLPALAGRGIARHGDGGDGGDARLPLGGMIKIYDALLARFMPPGFLINRRRELLHTFGGAGRWLTQPDGRPSRDLLDLLVPQLKVPVSAALQTSLKEGRPAVVDTPARDDGGEPLRIGVQLLPAREQDNAGCLLVTVEVHESGGAGDEPPVEAPLHVVAADAAHFADQADAAAGE